MTRTRTRHFHLIGRKELCLFFKQYVISFLIKKQKVSSEGGE